MNVYLQPLVKFDRVLEIKRDFDELLTQFNIPHGTNRFDQYERILNKMLSETNPKDSVYLRHAIAELSDLESLSTLYAVGILTQEKLRKILPTIVSGHPIKSERMDGRLDPSRNTLFELTLLNFLHLRGYNVKYEEGNDVILVKNGKFIAIECKRLRVISPTSIKNNLRKAYQQLEKTKAHRFLGIVAIGIEEYLFSKDEILLVESGEDAIEALSQFNKEFIAKHGKWWQLRDFIKDSVFCPAVFVCIKATVFDFKNNITGTGFFMTANNTSYPPSSSFQNIKFLEDTNLEIEK